MNIALKFLAVAVLAASVTLASAGESVMFNYQGRVKIEGQNYNGQGQFKFAILSPDMKSTLWSNDASSADGSQPTTGIPLSVSDGVFNLIMGSETQMEPINATIFQNREPLKLRTWFNDGVHGFEQLQPDYNLINTALITSETNLDDFVIFVDGSAGDDSNSGLKHNEAKKTIQAAVDIIPSRVRANISVQIADGTYPEGVQIYGIDVLPDKKITFTGDETWAVTSTGAPKVVITGKNEAGSTRTYCLKADKCNNLVFHGITFEEANGVGLTLSKGDYSVENCMIRNTNSSGLNITNQSYVQVKQTVTMNNSIHGFGVNTNSRAIMTDCYSKQNGHSGLAVMDQTSCGLDGHCEFNNNLYNGIMCINYSNVGASLSFSGKIQGNKAYGIQAGWGGYFANFNSNVTYSDNLQGASTAFNGGNLNW